MKRKIKNFFKIAIPNRGEVAVRIIRSSQELGIKTLLLHSEADRDSLAYRISDERICIGSSSVNTSYLNLEAVINGAVSRKVEALHPGFGFLSESPRLAHACQENNIQFIGPSEQCLHLLAQKPSVCHMAKNLGIPVLPSFSIPSFFTSKSEGEEGRGNKRKKNQKSSMLSREDFFKKASQFPYPLMAKMSEGGGGRGLRRVSRVLDLEDSLKSALREGGLGFRSKEIFLEKYLEGAKHIEIQIFGGADGYLYCLGERDCSIQRRHQKILEEAPASFLSETLKSEIKKAAFLLMKNLGFVYEGAATVEFLVKGEDFYFLEVNPRLQVEHPVTEVLTGVDLVKAQILTAQGRPVFWERKPEPFDLRGHAIECRIYAEDPFCFDDKQERQSLPSTGFLGSCSWPHGPGRRFDIGFEKGDWITPFYDALLAKVIVWDETRLRAINKMRRALKECILFGLKTNIPYLTSILEDEDFISGKIDTQFFSRHFSKYFLSSIRRNKNQFLFRQDQLSVDEKMLGEKVGKKWISSSSQEMAAFLPTDRPNPWFHPWKNHE